jgi:hypothetical protein
LPSPGADYRPPSRHVSATRRRALPEKAALALLGFMSLNAIPAGLLLVLRPDGSYIGLPPSLLEGTPFADFRVPGLALSIAVGGSSLAAFLLVLFRHRYARLAIILAGAVEVGWIVCQVAYIGYQGFLQPLILVMGLATLLASGRMGGTRRSV